MYVYIYMYIYIYIYICSHIPPNTWISLSTTHKWISLAPFISSSTIPTTCEVQHTATHCNTLQHTATHCNTLQHTATHCKQQQQYNAILPNLQSPHTKYIEIYWPLFPKHVLISHKHTATHRNTLQHTEAQYNAIPPNLQSPPTKYIEHSFPNMYWFLPRTRIDLLFPKT